MVQTCKCTCSQEAIKQHLTCSPEYSFFEYICQKEVYRSGIPLGHYKGGSSIIYLGENLELNEAISSITRSWFCLADN